MNSPSGDRKPGRGPRFETYLHRNRRVRVPTGYMAVGRIIAAHNLHGEVKVELHTDFPDRFAPGVVLYAGTDLVEVHIEQARPHQDQLLVRFAGIADRSQAEGLRGLWLFIPDAHAETLDEDTYFVHDIIGLSVQTAEGSLLGVVQDVLATGANDVYVITTPDDPAREILIPAIADVVQRVDLEHGIIVVTLPPGLVD